MKTREAARSLATRLVATSRAMGAAATACVTDMSWPIGHAVGNALEVVEAFRVLCGDRIPGTRELTLALGAEMVRLAGPEHTPEAALETANAALWRGEATEKFLALVAAQGGDTRALEHREPFHAAPVVVEVKAPRAGFLAACDCFALGEAVVAMGGGRRAKEDAVDPRVGLVMLRERGAKLAAGEAFAKLHLAARDEAMAARVTACFTFADQPPAPLPADLVLERVTA